MSFSYFDNDKQIQKIDIQVGAKWADYQTDNEKLNSIFNDIDDGDGIVQISEKMLLDQLVENTDNSMQSTAKNNILENEELDIVDVKAFKLQQKFDSSYYSMENIKKMYPEDKYTYDGENVIDKSTGETVLSFYTSVVGGFKTIKEFGDRKGVVRVQLYDDGRARVTEEADAQNGNSGVIGYDYDANGELVSYFDYKTRSDHRFSDIQKEIFERGSKNPNWVNTQAINFLDSVDDRILLKILADYNKNSTPDNRYFLDELSKNENIPADVREEFVNRSLARLEKYEGYSKEKTIPHSQVNTKYYQSNNAYSVNFNNDIVTITSEGDAQKEYKIDLNTLLAEVPLDIRPSLKSAIQKMPAEALVDLSIECDSFRNPQERKGFRDATAGSFSLNTDRITIGIAEFDAISPETIVHELGHAIDCRKIDPSIATTSSNPNRHDMSIRHNVPLKNAYYTALAKYLGIENYVVENPETHEISLDNQALIRDGYKKPNNQWAGESDNRIHKAYMFSMLEEGPSELYTLAMLGKSKNTSGDIVTPELWQEFFNALETNRNLPDTERHVRTY